VFLRLWFEAYTQLDAASEAKYQKTAKRTEVVIAFRPIMNHCHDLYTAIISQFSVSSNQ
jgi:hypothetical protein